MIADKKHENGKLASYSTAGMMFPASIISGFAIGYFCDKYFNTSPWLLIVFTIYGVFGGFYNLYKISKLASSKQKNDEK